MLEDMETGVEQHVKVDSKDNVINTWDIERLLDYIKRKSNARGPGNRLERTCVLLEYNKVKTITEHTASSLWPLDKAWSISAWALILEEIVEMARYKRIEAAKVNSFKR